HLRAPLRRRAGGRGQRIRVDRQRARHHRLARGCRCLGRAGGHEAMKLPIAAELARAVARARERPVPGELRETIEMLLVDIGGLCVAARHADYVRATVESWDSEGNATAIGHARLLSAASAAFVNGTAAHGEDFDDTFEGGPVHAGAVIVPAVLAACERHDADGASALRGIAFGVEVLCRLSLVVPKATHKAGFHPTAVFGAIGAAAGVAAALK